MSSEKWQSLDGTRHPVAAGLVALASVSLAFGLFAGVAGLVATRAFGLGGSSESTAAVGGPGPSLYLPEPTSTTIDMAPRITLPASPTGNTSPSESAEASDEASDDESDEESDGPSDEPSTLSERVVISLSAGATTVTSMGRIDLTGVYPDGEGAVLQVQRLEDGVWADFPVTTGVSGGQFATYVQTGQHGSQQWRMLDTDTGAVSNPVTVTVQ